MNIMDNSYGVGIANRFMLLEEENDDLENGSFEETSNQLKSSIKIDNIKAPLAKLHIDPKDTRCQAERSGNRREDVKKHKGTDLPKEYSNETINDKKGQAKFQSNDRNQGSDGKAHTQRGGMGFRGRPFANSRGVNRDNRPKREFDHGSDKMGGRGKDQIEPNNANWGISQDFITSPPADILNVGPQNNKEEEWNKEELVEHFEMPVPSSGENGIDVVDNKLELPIAEPEKELEVITMTLDEWKAMQEKEIVKPEYKLRKPGEGEDSSKWKGTYILKKEGDNDEEEEEYEEDTRHSGRTKNLLDIDITYSSPASRGRGGSGNRGAGFRMTRAFNSPAFAPQPGGNGPPSRGGGGGFDARGGGSRGRFGNNFNNRRGGGSGFNPHHQGNRNENNFRRNGPPNMGGNEPTFNDEADFPSLRTITAK